MTNNKDDEEEIEGWCSGNAPIDENELYFLMHHPIESGMTVGVYSSEREAYQKWYDKMVAREIKRNPEFARKKREEEEERLYRQENPIVSRSIEEEMAWIDEIKKKYGIK